MFGTLNTNSYQAKARGRNRVVMYSGPEDQVSAD